MAVVDPKRDIDDYLEISRNTGMRVTHIFETHVHADHVSGAWELERATGGTIYIHESAPVEYVCKKLGHGNEFTLGMTHIRILHTPGHTPNAISLLVSDRARSPEPQMLLSGDLLFVGDIGRPDLPGDEILEEQVRNLYDSLHITLGALPDRLELYPAHGQGSLCGGGLSAKPHSTLGYERIANTRMLQQEYDLFRNDILSDLPMRPQSFSHIIATNLSGAPLLPLKDDSDHRISPEEAAELFSRHSVVPLDLRDSRSFGAAHVPGSIHVDGTSSQAVNWIGTVLPPDAPFVLAHDGDYAGMLTQLRRIGYDAVRGYLRGGIEGWMGQGREVERLPMISAADFRESLTSAVPPTVIDVRSPHEYNPFKVEPSINLPFDMLLASRSCSFSSETEKLIICQSGYRSAIAASFLKAHGCKNVGTLAGGLAAAFSA